MRELPRETYIYRRVEGLLKSEFSHFSKTLMLALVAGVVLACAPAFAQRARFEDPFQIQTGPVSYPSPTIINQPLQGQPPAFLQQPPAILQQPVLPNATFGNPGFDQPNFDPFQATTQPFPVFPMPQTQPAVGAGVQTFPNYVQPQFNQPQYTAPQFGLQQPQYQGTNSSWLPAIDWDRPRQAWQSFQSDFLPRLLERPRARQTYLYGNNGNELNINDIELATTMTWPNFLQSNQPLRVSPGFIFHFWDGPDTTVHPGFDLPAQAYSGFLAFDHMTNPANQSGIESNFTVGYYSDFDNNSSDAFRFTGRLLGWSRLNPYTIGKLGVEYFDRVNVKLLPAFGFYLTPTPDIKFDLFFPKSKLSHRIPNFSDYEAWAYVGGEYGGGSWAIERIGGVKDQVDINDVRAFMGIEWMGPRRVTGFFEAGYVFNREILYSSDPLNHLEIQDTVMIRSGFAF